MFYIDQYEFFYKNFFNLSKLYLNQFINYISIYFLFFLFLYFYIWNLINKNNINNSNIQYLWQNFIQKEKQYNYKNLSQKLNEWSKIWFKKKFLKLNNKLIIKNLIDYYKNLLILFYQEKVNILNINNDIYNLKYIKLNLEHKKFINKIWIDWECFFKYKCINNLQNLINLKFYNNYRFAYNKNIELLYLLISFFYKKNIYAFLINKQELYKFINPLNKSYYILNLDNVKLQKKLNLEIIKFFNLIDLVIYNNKSPKWLLNRNNTTIFYNYSLNDKKETLESIILFPYELLYFFINIIYIYIYYKIIIYGLLWNQKYWIGANTFEKREWFNLIIYNSIWISYIKFLNQFDNINSSLLNSNSTNGIFIQQLTNIFINTNKYYYLNKLYHLKCNFNLNNNLYYFKLNENFNAYFIINYYYIKFLLIIINLIILFYLIWYKIIYKIYIKKFFFNIKLISNIKLIKCNKKKLQYIYFHYKFKKMLW